MRNAWSWLGLNLGKRAGSVAVIGLAVTLLLGLGITQLQFRTSNASYLNANDKAQIENQNYENLFGGDPIAAMFTMAPGSTIDDLFTQHNITEFQAVQRQLTADPSVFSVITPLDSITLAQSLSTSPDGNPTSSLAGQLLLYGEEHDPTAAGKAARLKNIESLLAADGTFSPAQQTLTNPAWVNFLAHSTDGSMRTSSLAFLPNDGHGVAIVFLKGDLSIEQESAAFTSVQAIFAKAHFDNVTGGTPLVTGVPALLKTINNYLKTGMLRLGGLAALIMVIILALLFNVRWRLLPFFVVAVGLVWAFGLAGYIGIPLTLASIAGLPVLLGIGIDYAIQLHSRVEEEVVLDRADHPIQATARNLGPALLVVTFDAVFAFLALTLAKVPMIRQFGWLLVVGIIAVCICSIILPLAILGIREYKSPTKGKDFSTGRLSRFVVWLGRVPPRAALALAIVSVVVFAGGLAVEGHITLQTDPLQWINPHDPTVQDINTLKAGTGTDNELGALITTDAPFVTAQAPAQNPVTTEPATASCPYGGDMSQKTVDYVTTFSDQLYQKYSGLLFPATGMVNLVAEFMEVPGASIVAPPASLVAQAYCIAPTDIQRSGVADDGKALSTFFRSKTAVLGDLTPVVNDLNDNVHPPAGIAVAPGGIAVVGVGLIDNLAASRTLLTYLAIIFVGLFLAVRLRSVWRSLLSLVPVLIAVGAVTLVAWALHLQLSPLTAVSGPLVVAVCTEFTSLILLRFVEERGRGSDPIQAMATTASRTGRAFVVSGLTAVAGVAVLATSSWPLLRDFGIVVGLNVLVALLSALIVLPPILVWAEGDGRNVVSRGLVRHDSEPPRPDAPPTPPRTVPEAPVPTA